MAEARAVAAEFAGELDAEVKETLKELSKLHPPYMYQLASLQKSLRAVRSIRSNLKESKRRYCA